MLSKKFLHLRVNLPELNLIVFNLLKYMYNLIRLCLHKLKLGGAC